MGVKKHLHTEAPLTEGVIFVYSCPPNIASNVDWAIARVIGAVVKLTWLPEPGQPECLQAAAIWRGPVGTGAELASTLFGWPQLRYEITEDQTTLTEGARWMHTPSLGILHQRIDAAGNVLVPEDAITHAIQISSGNVEMLTTALNRMLGKQWDKELEPFRGSMVCESTIFEVANLHVG